MASPLQATRATFREAVRTYLRDRPPYNTLLPGFETNDPTLDLCVELALSDFNTTAPVIADYTIANHPSFIILLMGTVIQVLQSAGILSARNRLDYSAGGISVQISDKAQEYSGILTGLIQQYEIKKRNLKIQLNMAQCYGGVSSEYAYTQE